MFRRKKRSSLLTEAIGASQAGARDASLEDLDLIRGDIEALRRVIFYRCLASAAVGCAGLFGVVVLVSLLL